MPVDVRRRAIAAIVGLVTAAAASSAQAANSPQVAVAPDGTAHFGWLDGLVTERTWAAGGALTDPQHVSPIRAQLLDFDMDASSAGAASFIWRRQKNTIQVEGRRRGADGSLGPVLALSASATDTQSPRIAAGPAGTSVFAWRRTGSSNSYIHARRLSSAGDLGPSLTLSQAGYTSRDPEVAMDANGNALVVWVRHAPEGGEVVQVRRIAADGALGAVESVSTSTAAAAAPQVAFDAAGNALVAWLRYDGNGFYPQIRQRSAAGAMSAIQTLSAATGWSAANLRLAVAPSGRAMAVWTRPTSQNTFDEVQGRHRAADGTLGSTFRVSPANTGRYKAVAPQVAVDANGNSLVTWSLQDWSEIAEPASVQLRRRAPDGGLGPIQNVSTEATNYDAGVPQIAIAADGTATLTWQVNHLELGPQIHARRRRASGTFTRIIRVDRP